MGIAQATNPTAHLEFAKVTKIIENVGMQKYLADTHLNMKIFIIQILPCYCLGEMGDSCSSNALCVSGNCYSGVCSGKF